MAISQELKQKLSKVYELVKRGSEGEKQAAEAALSRLIEKYSLQGIDLDNLDKNRYYFSYVDNLEVKLFCAIVRVMMDQEPPVFKMTYDGKKAVKKLHVDLTYIDFITVNSAYEYFRSHMKSQWKKACLDLVKKKRLSRTKNKARAELQHVFWNKYCVASKLYREEDLTPLNMESMTKEEIETWRKVTGVQGGVFHRQMTNGLTLDAG
jgi:hypothetical protein